MTEPRESRDRYPVTLVIDGRPCLVVGAGRIAARKIEGLAACGAVVTVIAPRIDPEVRSIPGITIKQRAYASGDVAGFRLIITATDDSDVNATVFRDAEAVGIWVNSADDPNNCSFTLPSVARRGPISIAVSTAGTSPALAAWLRRRIEAEIGPEYEVVLDMLVAERARLRAGGGTSEVRGWKEALDRGLVALVAGGDIEGARRLLQESLEPPDTLEPVVAGTMEPVVAGAIVTSARGAI